ncbi:hypothetical protein [Actinomadura parmotrematis]|uniref:Uncharacterized protein n=1 Tax=Actinomadura parmotrematis TaxID=2864039 RepID=A0ABS7FMB8_9ACTN|nr:hypothetical protein [Actinomadura parmotrematis]MBW8481516.1 hypothetical protein [Actinomadura parmotrematis]
MSLDEAARQLKMAAHDAQVAFDCIGLGELDRAMENAVTLRAAADAALLALGQANETMSPEQAEVAGENAMVQLQEDS